MASWDVRNDTITDTSSAIHALTTHGQFLALATGATIPRCGGHGALLRVMGPAHAPAFVLMLWSDHVAPTLRLLVLHLSRVAATLSLVVSPLLLSVHRAPSLLPTPPWGDAGRCVSWVDGHRYVIAKRGALLLRDVLCSEEAQAVVARETRNDRAWGVNSKWAACVTSRTSSREPVCLAVVPMGGLKALEGDDGCDVSCDPCDAVLVDMPMVEFPLVVYMDRSVDSEIVVAKSTRRSKVFELFVVDLEETYKRRSLALLSTVRCVLPTRQSWKLHFVMRNWDRCSAGYGSRTFIIKGSNKYHMFSGAEGVGNATPVLFPDNDATKYDVMRLSDSVLCLSLCKGGMFGLYHRDDVTQQMKHRINCSSKNEIVLVAAESGLMFVRYSAGIKVIEPITGVVVLTLNFPDWDCYNLEAPFSCFLS